MRTIHLSWRCAISAPAASSPTASQSLPCFVPRAYAATGPTDCRLPPYTGANRSRLRPNCAAPLGSQRTGGDGGGASHGYTVIGGRQSRPECTAIPGEDEARHNTGRRDVYLRRHKGSSLDNPAALEFMCESVRTKKSYDRGNVIGLPRDFASKYVEVARQALKVADYEFFASPGHEDAFGRSDTLMTRRCGRMPRLTSMKFLGDFLQPGDLVLLKGSEKAEDLGQIVSAWKRPAEQNNLSNFIQTQKNDGADQVLRRSTDLENSAGARRRTSNRHRLRKSRLKVPAHAPQCRPAMLEILAESLRAEWSQNEFGLYLTVQLAGERLLLLKPATFMNDTGPHLLRMADQLGFGPEDCVLIQDDINLDIGVVRNRTNGSSGGHRGVKSVIVAFQSEDCRRVKIGVGRPVSSAGMLEYVLTLFDASSRSLVANACREAAQRAAEIDQISITASIDLRP